MPITTIADLRAAAITRVDYLKSMALSNNPGSWYSYFDQAFMLDGRTQTTATLAAGNTANGIVPVAGQPGYPKLGSFSGLPGYVSRVRVCATTPGRYLLFDRLWVAGAFAFNANVNLTAQPDFSARVPNTDWTVVEPWVEIVTTGTGNITVEIDYRNQDNVLNTSPLATTIAPLGSTQTLRRCFPIPLAAGDFGIQRVDAVRGTVATAGTFNVMLLRRLCTVRVGLNADIVIADFLRTGMPRVYETSALYVMGMCDTNATGGVEMQIEIARG